MIAYSSDSDAGRWVSRSWLRRLALRWFLAGVCAGALVAFAAGAFSS
jgi:hypothetical protein